MIDEAGRRDDDVSYACVSQVLVKSRDDDFGGRTPLERGLAA